MKSPFPGMDPYLELYWGDIQSSLAVYARDQLSPQLPGDLKARVEQSIAVEADDPWDEEVQTFYPDVQVSETVDITGRTGTSASAVATEPIIVMRPTESQTLRSVWIVTADGNRLVTSIEFLSPSNKIGKSGREEFRAKQAAVLAGGASVVEIDLIRSGRHVLSLGLTRIARRYRKGYKVVVVRGGRPNRAEFYPIPLTAPLPTFKIPLRPSDPDATLNLQPLIEMAYEKGGYDSINYRSPLSPKLDPESAAWADELLKKAGKR